jgi:hypothetical protein
VVSSFSLDTYLLACLSPVRVSSVHLRITVCLQSAAPAHRRDDIKVLLWTFTCRAASAPTPAPFTVQSSALFVGADHRNSGSLTSDRGLVTSTMSNSVPLRTGPPTKAELIAYYPAKFTWAQLKAFINSGYIQPACFLCLLPLITIFCIKRSWLAQTRQGAPKAL